MHFGSSTHINRDMPSFKEDLSKQVRKLIRRVPNCIPERYKIPVSKKTFSLYMFNTKLEKIAVKSEVKCKERLGQYEIGKLLGTGKFGRVYLARDKEHDTFVAIKVLNKAEIKLEKLEHQVEREISNQGKMKHRNIVHLYSYFSDAKRIFLVMEYASGGEIFHHLRKSPLKRFSNAVAAKYIYQVADALRYCHQHNVIHRDIKPENLILTCEGDIKLSDFGWSVNGSFKRKTLCGTLDYIAPEMIEQKYYDRLVDNWCLGVLCYEFLVGVPPFQSENDQNTFRRIIEGDYSFPNFVCNLAMDLITKLLRKNPYQRLSLSRVMQHEWIAARKFLINNKCIDY